MTSVNQNVLTAALGLGLLFAAGTDHAEAAGCRGGGFQARGGYGAPAYRAPVYRPPVYSPPAYRPPVCPPNVAPPIARPPVAAPGHVQPLVGQPGTPQFGGPQPGTPQAGAPQTGTPQAGAPQTGGPQPGGPQAGGPQPGTSQAGASPAGAAGGGNASSADTKLQMLRAYQFLTNGQHEQAREELQRVLQADPSNELARQLLTLAQGNAPADGNPNGASPAPPQSGQPSVPATPQPQPQAPQHVGTFRASVSNGATVELTLEPGGAFRWTANNNDKTSSFAGTYTLENGMLTLVRSTDSQKLEGQFTARNEGGFQFKLNGSQDTGLNFTPATQTS